MWLPLQFTHIWSQFTHFCCNFCKFVAIYALLSWCQIFCDLRILGAKKTVNLGFRAKKTEFPAMLRHILVYETGSDSICDTVLDLSVRSSVYNWELWTLAPKSHKNVKVYFIIRFSLSPNMRSLHKASGCSNVLLPGFTSDFRTRVSHVPQLSTRNSGWGT